MKENRIINQTSCKYHAGFMRKTKNFSKTVACNIAKLYICSVNKNKSRISGSLIGSLSVAFFICFSNINVYERLSYNGYDGLVCYQKNSL